MPSDLSNQTIFCWHCKKVVGHLPMKVGFREQCESCGCDLHCCVNCRYYSPGKPNDCLIFGTEWVKDREKKNFCEEFALKQTGPKEPPSKKGFDSLFKDEG